MKTNYKILMDTINTLSYSQGFYARLKQELADMSDDVRTAYKEYINSLPQWKDTVNVILFLEQ